jgi:hypothetical protein
LYSAGRFVDHAGRHISGLNEDSGNSSAILIVTFPLMLLWSACEKAEEATSITQITNCPALASEKALDLSRMWVPLWQNLWGTND